MANLADSIEEYLKRLLTLSGSDSIEIKRKELAGKFRCVPSQVNYVLETRFTLEKGYLVESKRGGRGYVRIKKIFLPRGSFLQVLLEEITAGPVRSEQVISFLHRLYENKFISYRESQIMEAAVSSLGHIGEKNIRDQIATLLFKNMLLVLLRLTF